MADPVTESGVAPEGGASDKEDVLVAARKRFKQSIDAYANNRKDQLLDIKFAAASPDNQWQWPPDVLSKRIAGNGQPARPTLTINKLPQHIKLVTNEQRQNRPSIKVLPVDDKADVEVAEVLNGVIRHIEANSDADIAYDTAGESQVTIGEGYWRILTDYCDPKSFDQDIYIAPIKNSFSVYMDPDGLRKDSTGRFIDWCFITDKVHKDSFKKQFPQATQVDWQELGRGDQYAGWLEDDHVIIAEYFCFKDVKTKIVQWGDGSVTEGDAMPQNVAIKPIDSRETTVRKVMWSKMTGLEVLEEREWAGKYIPVVRVVGNEYEVDGKAIVSGIVRNAKDAQRMFNYWVSQEAELLALAPKAPFMASIEAIEGFKQYYENANTENRAYLPFNEYDDEGRRLSMPTRAVPPMPSPGILQAKLGAADDLQATVGQYNPSLGAEAKEKSGKAIMARQRQADVGTFHFIDNLARSIRQTGRIVIDLIPKIYDTKRVARILGEDGESDHVTFDPQSPQPHAKITDQNGAIQEIYNPGIGQYDVRVTVGPSYTTKRQEAAEFMANVLQGNKELMQVMGDLYFGMLDVPGADEIAKRLKKAVPANLQDAEDGTEQMIQTPEGPLPVSQAGQAIGQMHQQLQAMQAELQKADTNEKQARMLEAQAKLADAETRKYEAETRRLNHDTARLDTASKVSERAFEQTVAYVDRTPQDDTDLLAPRGAAPAPTETQ